MINKAKAVLKEFWGYDDFRGLQGLIIQSILSVRIPWVYYQPVEENLYVIKYLECYTLAQHW